MSKKFNPLAHHRLVLKGKNESISFADLMSYRKWLLSLDKKVLEELEKEVKG